MCLRHTKVKIRWESMQSTSSETEETDHSLGAQAQNLAAHKLPVEPIKQGDTAMTLID